MEKETKLRALCILKILYELSDVDHQLSTAEIAELLEEKYGLKVYRTTINSDIEQLRQFGIDICINKSTQNRYFIDGRLFDVPELKLLIDAVESSKFITKKKSMELVEKLGTLASKNSSTDLKRNLCIEGRLKPVNEQIYYIVDALNDAINQGKKVSFQYFQYNVKKEQKLRHDGEVYVVILTDYPKEIKAFYMKQNEDGRTVRAMDVLFPKIGEIIGGSEREADYGKLCARVKELGMHESEVWWYLDTRRWGSAPHSGFGLGFERLLLFVTGMGNIRDVIPFPRTPNNAEF